MKVERPIVGALPHESRSMTTQHFGVNVGGIGRQALACLLAALAVLLCFVDSGADLSVSGSQVQAYQAERPKSIIDLQQFRTAKSIFLDRPGGKKAEITLINLNPYVNRWYLLQISQEGHAATQEYHLENPFPRRQQVLLEERSPDGLILWKSRACPARTASARSLLWWPTGWSAP
jgi:hypothetical protein